MTGIESYTIPSRFPTYAFLGLMLGLVGAFGCFVLWKHYAPVRQTAYAKTYVNCSVKVALHRKTPEQFKVSATQSVPVAPAVLKAVLLKNVYGGDFMGAIKLPLYASGALLVCGLFAGSVYDGRRRKAYRQGVKIHGRDLLTWDQLNKQLKGDGFEVWTEV